MFEERNGSFDAAVGPAGGAGQPLAAALDPWRVRVGAPERAGGGSRRGRPTTTEPPFDKAADREARRTIAGTGRAEARWRIDRELHPRIDALKATYVVDGAALEVLRLTEMAAIFHAYEAELARRGALDYGEQIAGVTTLFKTRPNILRRWQRQFRYILVDEFQDANVAQIELIEMLGRTPDRPDNVMVVGDDDQSIYRFRGASFAAFAEFDARFSGPPTHDPTATPPGPPPHLRIEQNFRSVRQRPDRRQPADRQQRDALRARQAPDDRPTRRRPRRAPRLRRRRGRGRRHRRRHQVDGGGGDRQDVDRRRRPLPQAPPPRRHRGAAARRGHPVHRRRRPEPVRHARDPRPRAVAPGDRRPARRRRAGADDDRRSVAARCPRDPARDPDRQVRSGAPARDRRVDRRDAGRSRSTSSTSGARTAPSTSRSMPRR